MLVTLGLRRTWYLSLGMEMPVTLLIGVPQCLSIGGGGYSYGAFGKGCEKKIP